MNKAISIFQILLVVLAISFISTSCKKTCKDGKQNQKEEGVDCGGPCVPCSDCSDGIQSGRETGVDCGGDCTPCTSTFEFSEVSSGTTTSLRKVDCSGSNCAAIGEGGLIIISTDKGATWSSVSSGTSDELHGIDINGSTIYTCGENGMVRKSTNLGQSFTEIIIDKRENVQWNDVLFLDDMTGVVCGSKLAISYTVDGGQTWKNTKYTFDSQRSFYAFSSPANNALYVIGDNSIQLSSDQGGNWTQIALSDNNPDIKNLTDLHYVSSSRAFIAGEPSVLFSTNSIQWYDKALYTSFGGFSFTDNSGLYAGRDENNEKGKILETLDSGVSWKQIPLLNEDVRFNDCFIIDESNSIVIGEKGTILRR